MGDSMLRAAIAAVSLVVALPAAAQAPAAPPPAVVVAKVELRDLTRQKEFVGRIKSIDSVALRARVEGFLRERRFTEGQEVKPGDVLFIIEPDQFQAEVDSAKAEVAKAEATIRDTSAQLARARELIRNQNIAQSTVDQRAADDARARAQLLANQAALKQAELNLSYTQIVAPVAGRIGQATITPGNLVNPQSGTLATIVSQDPIYVNFQVSAREFVEAQRRIQAIHGTVGGSVVVRIRLADGTLFPEPGRIDFTDVQTDKATDTVLVRARVANPTGTLIDGQTVRVIAEADKPERALMVPQAGVQLDQAGTFVLIVDAEKKAQIRRIKIGPAREGFTSVTDGLKEGDLVIVQGIQRVRPGMVVNVTEAPPVPPS